MIVDGLERDRGSVPMPTETVVFRLQTVLQVHLQTDSTHFPLLIARLVADRSGDHQRHFQVNRNPRILVSLTCEAPLYPVVGGTGIN